MWLWSWWRADVFLSALPRKFRPIYPSWLPSSKQSHYYSRIGNKINDLILNLTPENVTQHSRIVTTTRKGSSTPTKMSKIIGRQIH